MNVDAIMNVLLGISVCLSLLFLLPFIVQIMMEAVRFYWGFLCGVFNGGDWGVDGGIHGWPLGAFIVWGCVLGGIVFMAACFVRSKYDKVEDTVEVKSVV
jgi:hypothetical protein